MAQIPAGWYVDVQGVTRWWDGQQWTAHTHPPPPPTMPAVQLQTWGASDPVTHTVSVPFNEQRAMPEKNGVAFWTVLLAGALIAGLIATLGVVLVTSGGN